MEGTWKQLKPQLQQNSTAANRCEYCKLSVAICEISRNVT
jgi:hypothetical protein